MQSPPSVRLSIRLFPLYHSNRLTFGLDLLHVCGSQGLKLTVTGQGQRVQLIALGDRTDWDYWSTLGPAYSAYTAPFGGVWFRVRKTRSVWPRSSIDDSFLIFSAVYKGRGTRTFYVFWTRYGRLKCFILTPDVRLTLYNRPYSTIQYSFNRNLAECNLTIKCVSVNDLPYICNWADTMTERW